MATYDDWRFSGKVLYCPMCHKEADHFIKYYQDEIYGTYYCKNCNHRMYENDRIKQNLPT